VGYTANLLLIYVREDKGGSMSFSIGFDTNRMKKEAGILDNLLKKKEVLVLYSSDLDSASKLLEVHKDYRKGNKHYFIKKGNADTMQGKAFLADAFYLEGKKNGFDFLRFL
tara:strand:+ start:833 stop:1165 length:333 start_codon:yes stop_codon:yes gene_type:complete